MILEYLREEAAALDKSSMSCISLTYVRATTIRSPQRLLSCTPDSIPLSTLRRMRRSRYENPIAVFEARFGPNGLVMFALMLPECINRYSHVDTSSVCFITHGQIDRSVGWRQRSRHDRRREMIVSESMPVSGSSEGGTAGIRS